MFYSYQSFYFIEVYLIYNVLFMSAVQQSDSDIHIYVLFYILFHYGLLQGTEYSSLCCGVRPCGLCILYFILSWYPGVVALGCVE